MKKPEIWKDIEDYKGLYQVSNLGRVRSIKNKTKIKEPFIINSGYSTVNLYKNNKNKKTLIHRLVAQAFILNPKKLPQVNHIDGNKLNNRQENLEWCSNSDNMLHASKTGLLNSYIKINQYDLNHNFIKQWNCIKEIERELNYNHSGIIACCKKRYKTSHNYIWEYVTIKEVN